MPVSTECAAALLSFRYHSLLLIFCFLSLKVTFNHGLWAKNTMYYVSPLKFNHFLVINELSFIFILIITAKIY